MEITDVGELLMKKPSPAIGMYTKADEQAERGSHSLREERGGTGKHAVTTKEARRLSHNYAMKHWASRKDVYL